MRNQLGIILLIAVIISAVSFGILSSFLEIDRSGSDDLVLKTQYTCDSLRRANREQELHIMQLEHEVEDIQDQLSDCTEDFQNCLAGRKIQMNQNGSTLTSNPEH